MAILDSFPKLALRSPTATGSPLGRSLAPWFGPDFEIFRIFEFSDFPLFPIFNFLIFNFPNFHHFKSVFLMPQMKCVKFDSDRINRSKVEKRDGRTDRQNNVYFNRMLDRI